MADFDELLQAAHDRGLKIIMDLVVNHTSDEHPWFKRSRQDRTNQYRDFYFWRSGNGKKAPNNWDAAFGGSAWKYDEQTGIIYTFSTKQPDLNWENPTARVSLYDDDLVAEQGVDGFRMDVINQISKLRVTRWSTETAQSVWRCSVTNGPRIHEFLQEMN